MLEAIGLITCLYKQITSVVFCDKSCQIITGISNVNLAFQDWKTCIVKGICKTSCHPSCQSLTKRFPFYVTVHALKQNENYSPLPWIWAGFLEYILWPRLIFYLLCLFWHVHQLLLHKNSEQSRRGKKKTKQWNFKSTNGSHSFGNNFCHKPKGYKLKVDRGERYWNNN